MVGISNYLNSIYHRSGHLKTHTNTTSRIASRLLPYHHEDHGACGILCLRLINFTCRQVCLIHLPTEGRLDLVDPYRWQGMDIARMIFRQETT